MQFRVVGNLYQWTKLLDNDHLRTQNARGEEGGERGRKRENKKRQKHKPLSVFYHHIFPNFILSWICVKPNDCAWFLSGHFGRRDLGLPSPFTDCILTREWVGRGEGGREVYYKIFILQAHWKVWGVLCCSGIIFFWIFFWCVMSACVFWNSTTSLVPPPPSPSLWHH